MTKDEALKLAIGKIKSARDCHFAAIDPLLFEAEEILEQALAAPTVQEPVAIGWDTKTDTPIMGYTTPPATQPAVPLTDEQKLMCWSRATHDADVEHKTEHQCLMDYGSEIEAAHGITKGHP
jgi:hypothetical protein